jgi:Ca-activated chloride channel homolog
MFTIQNKLVSFLYFNNFDATIICILPFTIIVFTEHTDTMKLSLLPTFIVFVSVNLFSQIPQPPKPKPVVSRILFVFDASQSMNGTWEKARKIDVAKNVLINMIDSLEKLDNIELALRVYGHQKPVPPQDCSDSKLEVPFAKGNAPAIRQKLRFLYPMGTTPIANSLALAGKDFGEKSDCRNIIILITDGIEACDGDPCKVSRELQTKGISLKPFVIGIGIDENFKESFNCIGKYYNTRKEEQFKEAMNVVISQALNATTAQINLLDINGKPTETDVNMSFYDYYSGKLKNNYMHTMNNRSNPDTIVLDPLVTYRMIVHTIPPVKVDSFKLTPGKHNIIAVDAPQGYLVINSQRMGPYRNISTIVRQSKKMTTLNYQEVNRSERYIVGKYDLEIPVLPRIYLNNVEIKQSSTTTITIPQDGMANFLMQAPGFASLYVREKGKKMQWIYNLTATQRSEIIYLQPGSYTVVYRALNAKQTLYTITKTFDIVSGGSKMIELY